MFLDHRHLQKIEQKADELLQRLGIDKPPVPIRQIIENLGLRIIRYDLGPEISGILVIEENHGAIGFNEKDAKTRQRFTMAHELGHYIFHNQLGSEVFIDRDFIVKYRSQKEYSNIELRQEQQANIFAASILMPRKMLQNEFAKGQYKNLSESDFIASMAKIFDVSVQAMTYRIANSSLI